MQRRRRWAVAGMLVLASVAAVGSATKENTASKVDGTQVQATSRSSETKVFQVGDVVELGDWQVVVHEVTDPLRPGRDDLFQPSPGNRWVAVDAEVTNLSRKAQTVSSLLCFEVQDDTKRAYNVTIAPTEDKSVDGEVDANGGARRGTLVFEVGKEATGLQLRFSCELFERGTAIIALG